MEDKLRVSFGNNRLMILFPFDQHAAMAAELQKAVSRPTIGQFQAVRFENGELHMTLQTQVAAKSCWILGSLAPPDENILIATLLAHTLKKEEAGRVIGAFPYLAYARDDKAKPGYSLGTAWAGSLVGASGFDQVITVDVHSLKTSRLFPIPVISLSPAQVFANALNEHRLTGATIIAPDEGAIGRCDAVKAAAGMQSGPTVYFKKQRNESGIVHTGPIGRVGGKALVIDDILDTGGTLLSACGKLIEAGVEEIYIMVTHGLFTGERWKGLWELGVKQIFCTDSIPLPDHVDVSNIKRLSIVPLLAKALAS